MLYEEKQRFTDVCNPKPLLCDGKCGYESLGEGAFTDYFIIS